MKKENQFIFIIPYSDISSTTRRASDDSIEEITLISTKKFHRYESETTISMEPIDGNFINTFKHIAKCRIREHELKRIPEELLSSLLVLAINTDYNKNLVGLGQGLVLDSITDDSDDSGIFKVLVFKTMHLYQEPKKPNIIYGKRIDELLELPE